MSPLTYKSISLSAFNATLSRYASTVPERLHDLDALRYDTIPSELAEQKGNLLIPKEQVEKLVEWKLKHGTFRPKLLQLVQSNDEDTVTRATADAFEIIAPLKSDSEAKSDASGAALKALKVLTALKGIGPATASLLLSVAAPKRIPFFSDELFRWCMWDEPGSLNGWKRSIKYNAKEYEQVVKRVDELVSRLGVRAVDAERVAYVLGKEGADVGAEEDGEQSANSKKDEDEKSVEHKPMEKEKSKQKQGTKRKASDPKPPAEGTRKSSRTRK